MRIKRFKLLSLLSVLLVTLLMSACSRSHSTVKMGNSETNLLGVAKLEKDNYLPTKSTTFAVSSDEIFARENFSGDKVTLFWGLITLKDY